MAPIVALRSRRGVLPAFALLASMAFVLVLAMAPATGSLASAVDPGVDEPTLADSAQSLVATGAHASSPRRDAFSVTLPTVAPAAILAIAPRAAAPDPGSAKAIGLALVTARGWGQSEYNCLVALWDRESHWNVYAQNVGSGAYGIPQAVPGNKMASVAADWRTNPRTQIIWGLNYIQGRYGTPCGAWGHSQSSGWY